MKEIWKDIEGYEGLYQVSNQGRVKSLERIKGFGFLGSKLCEEKILKNSIIKKNSDYRRVVLYSENKKKKFQIHRLVAQTFIPNPENKPTVNHKDGVKDNNYVENLEWNTFEENNNHAIKFGLNNFKGIKHPNSKLNEKQIIKIYNSKERNCDLAKKYNVLPTTISGIKRGVSWKHLTSFLILLLMFSFVSASSPLFDVDDNLLGEVRNGESAIGNIVILENGFQPDYLNIATIQENLTAQQYDLLGWLGSQSIRITSPSGVPTTIVQNGEYNFQSYGDYTITLLSNISIYETITVSPATTRNMNITIDNLPDGVDINISNDEFVLDNEKVVYFTIDIDDDLKPDDYNFDYSVNDEKYTHDFEVLSYKNFTVDTSEINLTSTIKSGESNYLGRFEVKNTGNTEIEVEMLKQGNATHLIGIPSPKSLFQKGTIYFDLNTNIPTTQKSGNYQVGILIKSGDIEKTFSINLTIVDSIKPVIESINYSTTFSHVPNEIIIVATDNDNVRNVTLEYDDKFVNFEKDGNVFTQKVLFDKISRYDLKYCAIDYDDNEFCKNQNMTFTKSKVIEGYNKTIKLPSVKIGKYSQSLLFNLTENVPEGVIVRLVDVQNSLIDNGTTQMIRIIDGDGAVKKFSDFEKDIKLTQKGMYYLDIRADVVMDIDGTLRIVMPEQYEEVQDTTFKVSFKSYDVPQDFIKEWSDGRNLVCRVHDSGDLDSSYFDCSITFPSNTKREDVFIPVTISEKESFEDDVLRVEEELSKSRRKNGFVIAIIILMMVILSGYTFFMMKFYPLMRFKRGKTKLNNL